MSTRQLGFAGRIAHYFINSKLTPLIMAFSILLGAFAVMQTPREEEPQIVVPMMDHLIRIDRDALTLGYAGVYSSFLLFAKRAEAKYKIPAREILMELGRRGMVGGQEDMIEDTALTMARERRAAA